MLNSLAYLLLSEPGQIDEAFRCAQQALKIAPDDPNIPDTVGWVLYRKGMYKEAVRYLEKAASKADRPVMKYHVSMAHLKTGDRARALVELESALRAAPNLPEAREAQGLFVSQ